MVASGFPQAGNQAIVDDQLGTTNRTATTTPVKLRLESVAGSATAAGTELTGTTFPTITFHASTAANPSVGASNGTTSVTIGQNATVNAVAVWDTAGTPIRKAFAPMTTPRAVLIGDILAFADSAIQVTQASST